MNDFGSQAFRELMEAFAVPEPLPAGGAAGVVALCLGAAVGAKALRISGHGEAADRLVGWAERVAPLYQADCEAFREVLSALRAAQPTGQDVDPCEMQTAAVQVAWQKATAIPGGCVRLAQPMLAELESHQDAIKSTVRADHRAAVALIQAAVQIATENARDNAAHLDPNAAGP